MESTKIFQEEFKLKKLLSLILSICTLFIGISNAFAKGEKFHVPVFGDNYENQRNFIREYVGPEKAPDQEDDICEMYSYISGYDTIYFYNIKPDYREDKTYGKKMEKKIEKLLNLSENICAIVCVNINDCSIDEMRKRTTDCVLTVKKFNKNIQLIVAFCGVYDIEKELQDEERCKMLTATKDCIRDIEYDYLEENPGVLQFRNQSHFPALKLKLEEDMKKIGKLCYFQIRKKKESSSSLGNVICEHPVATLGICACIAAIAAVVYSVR